MLFNSDEMNTWHHGYFATSCLEEVIHHHSSVSFICFSPTIFISYGFITNYHRFSNFKEHTISQFPRVRSLDIGLSWVLSAQGLTRLKPGCQLGYILIWGSFGEEFTSKLIQAVGKIHFLVAVGPSATAMCWLQARGWPQVLELPHISQESTILPRHVDVIHVSI